MYILQGGPVYVTHNPKWWVASTTCPNSNSMKKDRTYSTWCRIDNIQSMRNIVVFNKCATVFCSFSKTIRGKLIATTFNVSYMRIRLSYKNVFGATITAVKTLQLNNIYDLITIAKTIWCSLSFGRDSASSDIKTYIATFVVSQNARRSSLCHQ